jgi:hypothetical protein
LKWIADDLEATSSRIEPLQILTAITNDAGPTGTSSGALVPVSQPPSLSTLISTSGRTAPLGSRSRLPLTSASMFDSLNQAISSTSSSSMDEDSQNLNLDGVNVIFRSGEHLLVRTLREWIENREDGERHDPEASALENMEDIDSNDDDEDGAGFDRMIIDCPRDQSLSDRDAFTHFLTRISSLENNLHLL